jgi:D-glycero-beta-D-manno-heptose-7-phosphate kinase
LRESLRLQALLVTLGEDGMTLFDAQGQVHVQAQAREVFDVTGAGDTVIATLASLVAAGMNLREAMPLANKAGGIVVGKFGTATVSYEELFG